MSGQPTIPGLLEFDVTDLVVGDNIIQKGDDLEATVTFDGDGWIWTFIEVLATAAGVPVTAQFYAEGMGIGPGEFDLGTVDVTLSGGAYTATVTCDTGSAPTDMDEGVYRIQCLVQVGDSAIVGHADGDVLISVHEP